jgi:MoaA/NifB/PqqE/SkfB family radical SAM enzyme
MSTTKSRPGASHGWAHITAERKRELIAAILSAEATPGPAHAELDLTDRCNVGCYFCNQQDTRSKNQIPLERAAALIDELVGTGLKSVRLSGGGDPLFHRDILGVLDHLSRRGVVIDNLTTNGVALGPEVASRLVRDGAREVVVSLNAVDAEDHHRMMRVKPDRFARVVANVRGLVTARGEADRPVVVVKFLLDRVNFHRLVDMYELGRSLGSDRISISWVEPIPHERIDPDLFVTPEDRWAARPLVEEVFRRDRGRNLLELYVGVTGWNEMIAEARRTGGSGASPAPTAPAFREENGGCFFAWYSTAITGNGNLHPCCMLINPDVEPLGNVLQGTFAEHWHGPAYTTMRREMREVLISQGRLEYSPKRFEVLQPPCVQPGRCWLKNAFFRGDDDFYRELGAALDRARAATGNRGSLPRLRRRVAGLLARVPAARPAWRWLGDRSRPLRIWLKRRFGVDLTDAVNQPVGTLPHPRAGGGSGGGS